MCDHRFVIRYLVRRPASKVDWALLVFLPFLIGGQFLPPRGLDHVENALALVGAGSMVVVWAALGKMRADERREHTEQLLPVNAKLDRLEQTLRQLRTDLEHVRQVVPEIEAELQLRAATIASLTAEAEDLDRLAELKRVEAGAVEELIRRTVRTGQAGSRERLYFLAGLLLSMPIGLIVNFAYDKWIK